MAKSHARPKCVRAAPPANADVAKGAMPCRSRGETSRFSEVAEAAGEALPGREIGSL